MPMLEISEEDSECKHGICRRHNQQLRLLNEVLKQKRTIGHLLCGSRAMYNTQEKNRQKEGCFRDKKPGINIRFYCLFFGSLLHI